tara:strand:- start:3715 stop:4011 length:297 start_codon:yes stop_codon:yes gene_type:complete
MKNLADVQTLRQIKVKFLGPTNHRGARVKIFEPGRWAGDKTESITVPFSYSAGGADKQAFNLLTANGFNIVAKADTSEELVFLCDNWDENFVKLDTIK